MSMKFQGSNLDKWKVNPQINKFYHLQNMDSTSVVSNATEVNWEVASVKSLSDMHFKD